MSQWQFDVIDNDIFRQVLASCLACAALAQYVEPEKAKILKEQRFNAGDGRSVKVTPEI